MDELILSCGQPFSSSKLAETHSRLLVHLELEGGLVGVLQCGVVDHDSVLGQSLDTIAQSGHDLPFLCRDGLAVLGLGAGR